MENRKPWSFGLIHECSSNGEEFMPAVEGLESGEVTDRKVLAAVQHLEKVLRKYQFDDSVDGPERVRDAEMSLEEAWEDYQERAKA